MSEEEKEATTTTNTSTPEVEEVKEESSTELPEKSTPEPIQIVSIGNEENAYAFTFHEEAFFKIISQIPPGWKVSIVSVVGAFRTGKSFLLSWFLRYLHFHNSKDAPQLISESSDDDSDDADNKWYHKFNTLDASQGFHWRGGSDRNTTGIWMWSQPFFVKESSDEPLALLLVDTQGMFDHETTMGLTAAIFGLSTLLSSYQIYNVDKNIQEDNLQQLALFTEYGRMVMTMDNDDDSKNQTSESQQTQKPFQRMEFLVRDWQHFESDEEGDLKDLEKEMSDYLQKVLSEKEAKDLKDTRDQISSCFAEMDCFMLTHPGSAVTKKKYDGDTKQVDPTFLRLLDRFCHKVFAEDRLKPKTIHGRALTAVEFGNYVKAFAKLFAGGAHFPEASTMLEATASANNTNATAEGTQIYKEKMENVAGPNVTEYIKPEDLEKLHDDVMDLALKTFDKRANFGSKSGIEKSKRELLTKINSDWELYSKLNEGRNPFGGLEV